MCLISLTSTPRPTSSSSAGGDDVVDDEVQAPDRSGRGTAEPGADADRTGRARRAELHDAEALTGAVIDVNLEARLLLVERLCPVDVGDGQDHELELEVHALLLR